jgi:isoamylase
MGRRSRPVIRAQHARTANDRIEPGRSQPLGATYDGAGVNFALFAAHAERVELCLFDPAGTRELSRIALPECTDHVWHGYLPDGRPGLVYGYRVHGPYDPENGHRCNAHKLLLDPYARAYVGTLRQTDANYGYRVGHARRDLSIDRRDNAFAMPKCRVVDAAIARDDDTRPRVPWADMIVCEAHVKGYTMMNAGVPEALRGTYAGFGHPASIAHLTRLGVTTVELLPVHEFVDERTLIQNGLVNYWGYNSIGFFAPAARYAGGRDPHVEFRAMVKRLHAAGIEVILDVVYNHTGEGDEHGPTLSFRGIDNASYYRLVPGSARHYDDVTGCGNTLNLGHPRVLQLVMDSLRYWVETMRVDGFRFDLATALARGPAGFDPGATFLDTLRQDPVLAGVKLIAEPWDLATYATGRFPAGVAEWNDKYRDALRGFWLIRATRVGDLAQRIAGSSDLFRHDGRRPQAGINFVTAHDGFPLADLSAYTQKHNEANGQDNRDGTSDNRSTNCGVEGPTQDPAIAAARQRRSRALLATLLASQGIPMLTAGDEIGRTQGGNNNAYCQDNPVSWIDWGAGDVSLASFVAALTRFRREQPALRRTRWFDGSPTGTDDPDITWLARDGTAMTREHWQDEANRCLGFVLGRANAAEDAIAVLINGSDEEVRFALPPPPGLSWRRVLDSATGAVAAPVPLDDAVCAVPACAVVFLVSPPRPSE